MATIAYAPTRWLAQEWERTIDGAAKRNDAATQSGIVGDAAHRRDGGYHISREDQPGDNYSVAQYAADRYGPSDAAAAVDMTMKRDGMVTVTKRLLAAAKARDPRLVPYVRAFNGTTNGTTAIRVEVQTFGLFSATVDHVWHVHLEIHRKYVNNMAAMRAILSVIAGEALGAWKARTTPAPTPPPAPKTPPAFPLKSGHVFGLISGPATWHGGFYASERPTVARIQRVLQAKGYAPKAAGWADGKYEGPTRDAVIRFQRARKLKADGLVGPATWRALFS